MQKIVDEGDRPLGLGDLELCLAEKLRRSARTTSHSDPGVSDNTVQIFCRTDWTPTQHWKKVLRQWE